MAAEILVELDASALDAAANLAGLPERNRRAERIEDPRQRAAKAGGHRRRAALVRRRDHVDLRTRLERLARHLRRQRAVRVRELSAFCLRQPEQLLDVRRL